MKPYVFFSLLFVLLCLGRPKAQETVLFGDAFTESTSDRDRLLLYIDSIDKYLYRDAQIVDQAIEECEYLIQKSDEFQKEDLFKYAIQKIYYEQNRTEYLKAYHTVSSYDHLLDDDEIPEKLKDNFMYIKGFTLMSLRDLESAISVFYQILEKADQTQNDKLRVNALYSLGQLYSDEEQYDKAIQLFTELDLMKDSEMIRPTTHSLIDYELAEVYLATEQFDKAAKLIEEALSFIDQHRVDILKSDFLLFKGEIALQRNDFQLAQQISEEVSQLVFDTKDPISVRGSQFYNAELFRKKGLHRQALKLYEQIFAELDSTAFQPQLNCLEAMHELHNEMGEPTLAYQYALQYSELKEKMNVIEKEQKTAYLKIKFEVAKKERENQMLALRVMKEQTQIKWLYFFAFLFLLGMLIFYLAFTQKMRFNQKLREEVNKRTEELELINKQLLRTNKELDEFNRILSHDLREPLRSIVGFSHLVIQDGHQDPKMNEYLSLIENSGRQLDQIIQDVSTFQKVKYQIEEAPKEVNLNHLLVELIEEIRKMKHLKTFQVSATDLPVLYTNEAVIRVMFQQLMVNSIKFNQQDLVQIKIRYYQEAAQHCFEFEDNGIGIDPQFHQSIFGMFKRLNNRSKYVGSGLGLSMVKKVLEKIEGTIKILRSRENEGAVFLIQIPVLNSDHRNLKPSSDHLSMVLDKQ